MSTARCQVCSRRKALRGDGTISRHYYKGGICLGAWEYPYEEGCNALETARDFWRRQAARCEQQFIQHKERRSNEPLSPGFWQKWSEAVREYSRLHRRLLNWVRQREDKEAAA